MHLVEVESRETDFQSRPHKRGCTVQAVAREANGNLEANAASQHRQRRASDLNQCALGQP
jgi:hypothetical protein